MEAAGEKFSPGLLQHIQEMETEAGLPAGFSMSLLGEADDWGFVVKLHALCETTVTQTILRVLEKPEVDPLITRLNMKDKVRFAVGLKVLSTASADFLEALGFLRNRLVHDVTQVATFTLASYEASPPKNAKPSHLFGGHLSAFKTNEIFSGAPHRAALWGRTLHTWVDMDLLRIQGRLAQMEASQRALMELMTESETKEGEPRDGPTRDEK